MKNSLHINCEQWPDATAIPHFVVHLNYERLVYDCDDIYFDNLDSIVPELLDLEKTRRGRILLDGGFRFQLSVQATRSGGIDLNFRTESDQTFPGKCVIEGCFSVDGEHSATTIGDLVRLFNDCNEFVL